MVSSTDPINGPTVFLLAFSGSGRCHIMVVCFFAPESPWCLVRKDRLEDAKRSIRRLGGSKTDEQIAAQLAMMVHTTKIEAEIEAGVTYMDCFKEWISAAPRYAASSSFVRFSLAARSPIRRRTFLSRPARTVTGLSSSVWVTPGSRSWEQPCPGGSSLIWAGEPSMSGAKLFSVRHCL